MNTFNKKSLCVALAATGLLGAAGAAQAVNLSEDGTGNVLIFPYYTVRNGPGGNAYNTYVNIANTTNSAKSVKVRFREGRNSKEVLDFNVFLSPFDMWTGAVIPTDQGAAIVTYDRSCTIPNLVSGVPVAFRNIKYTGSGDDGAGTTLDRTREGYVEVLEMGTYASTSNIYAGSIHSKVTGLPADCAKVTDTNAATETLGVSGGLIGSLQLINPGAGASMSVNPVAIDNYYPAILSAPTAANGIYRDTGLDTPNLTDADTVSAVKAGGNLYVTTGWANGADAVSAVLMHSSVMNEFILDQGTLSRTDWVVTMPTKNQYAGVGTGAAKAPFQLNFDKTVGMACDDFSFAMYDREEREYVGVTSGPDFSPKIPGPTGLTPKLCYEANVVTFNAGKLLGSSNSTLDIITKLSETANDNAANGWLKLSTAYAGAKLIEPGTTTVRTPLRGGAASAAAAGTYSGLPMIGFNVWNYTNSALKVGSVVANVPTQYGMGVTHKYTTSIAP